MYSTEFYRSDIDRYGTKTFACTLPCDCISTNRSQSLGQQQKCHQIQIYPNLYVYIYIFRYASTHVHTYRIIYRYVPRICLNQLIS